MGAALNIYANHIRLYYLYPFSHSRSSSDGEVEMEIGMEMEIEVCMGDYRLAWLNSSALVWNVII